MKHVTENQLYAYIFDELVLTVEDKKHLAQCKACQVTLHSIQQLTQELLIMQQSATEPQTLKRYVRLFAQVQPAPSLLSQLNEFIRTQLTWDSRRQLTWQGVRGTAPTAYRLLYESMQIDIELMVEPRKVGFHIEGEVLPNVDHEQLLPVLVEVQPKAGGALLATLQSDASGHFQFDAVSPGDYSLIFTPPYGAIFTIETLEIA